MSFFFNQSDFKFKINSASWAAITSAFLMSSDWLNCLKYRNNNVFVTLSKHAERMFKIWHFEVNLILQEVKPFIFIRLTVNTLNKNRKSLRSTCTTARQTVWASLVGPNCLYKNITELLCIVLSHSWISLCVIVLWFFQVGKLLMENAQLALQSDSMKSKAAAIQARSAGNTPLPLSIVLID